MPDGVKGIDKQGLTDLANIKNTIDLASAFDDFLKINELLLKAEDALANSGLEEFKPHGYVDQSAKINKLYDDTLIVLNAPEKILNAWEDIDGKFSGEVNKALEILNAYKPGEVSSSQVDANAILGNNMQKVRKDIETYLTVLQSETSSNDFISAVDSEIGDLEKQRKDCLSHGDLSGAKRIEAEIDKKLKEKIAGLNHGESFAAAYDKFDGYSTTEKIKIYFHWKAVDNINDLTGVEMPEWWKEKYLELPEYLTDETNGDPIEKIKNDQTLYNDLREYYYNSYFILDIISGRNDQEYTGGYGDRDDVTYNTDVLLDMYKRSLPDENGNVDPLYFDTIFTSWIDYISDDPWGYYFIRRYYVSAPDILKRSFITKDPKGNDVYDYKKFQKILARSSELSDSEYNVIISVLKGMGIKTSGINSKESLVTDLEGMLKTEMYNNPNGTASGGFNKTPYYSLTFHKRVIYDLTYGIKNPEHMKKMSEFLKDIPDGTWTDSFYAVHKYEDDYYNIMFIAFTGDETAKKVFFDYIDKIKVGSWDTNDTSCWGEDKTKSTHKRFVYLDLDGYTNNKSKSIQGELLNPRGAYVTVFHEIGHAIDDLYRDGKDDCAFETERVDLTSSLVKEVRTDCEDRLKLLNSSLTDEEINTILNVYVGPMVKFDGVGSQNNDPIFATWTTDMQKAYDALKNSYTGNDANLSWKNQFNGNLAAIAGVTDVYFGCVDNKGNNGDFYGHINPADYWYLNGVIRTRPGKEFFAHMFSFEMTHSPKDQIGHVTNSPGVFNNSYKEYSNILSEMEQKEQ